MATIGQGIQAGLGRIDYSPYLQGSAAGAQGIAQGIAQFGQSVGTGIQNYLKKQEEKKLETEGIEFIKSQFPGVDDAAAKAGYKAFGGAAAYAKFRNEQALFEMQKKESGLRLGELERQIAGRDVLNRGLSASPAQQAISAGATFESLPTGAGAFLSQGPRNTTDFIERAQRSGAPADLWLPQAVQFSQVEENVAQAKQRMAGKPELGYASPEEALSKSAEMAKGRKGVTPSFSVVQGRYFPIFREEQPGAFEKETDKLKAQSYQKRLDKFTSDYDNAISAGNSATLILEGLNSGKTTGIFQPLLNFVNRVAESSGIKETGVVKDELLAKGIAGQQASQISLLARGLGSMSNADREFYVATTPSITDSTLANRYFAEMAKENEKFAKQDKALEREMRKNGSSTEEIVDRIEELRETRNVARDVYRRVVLGQTLSPRAAQYATP